MNDSLPHKDKKLFKAITLISGILVVVSVCGSFYFTTRRANTNCQRIHSLYLSIDQILIDTDARIDNAVKERSISVHAGKEAKTYNRKNRKTLRNGDCSVHG